MGGDAIRAFVAEWPENQFFNLAFEEAFFRYSSRPVIRFWRNDKVIVIGRLQSPVLEVNAVEALKHGVKLVRRFTGGGAVYHDLGNVNYAVVLPGYSLSIEGAFKLVGETVVEALKNLGVESAHYRPLNDIEVDGLKISGLAATKTREKVFIHGAMLVSSDIDVLWRVLKVSREKLSDKKLAESRVKRVTTLREVLGRNIGAREVYEVFGEAFAKKLGLVLEWGSASRDELYQALELYEKRYSKLEWNLAYTEELRTLITGEEYSALRKIASPSPEQEEVVERIKASIWRKF